MSDSKSSFGKWLGGILATIITGVVLWWLTGPISPFVPKSSTEPVSAGQYNDGGSAKTEEATPDKEKSLGNTNNPPAVSDNPPVDQKAILTISKFNLVNPINIGQSTTGDFEITNNGNTTATSCQIIWKTPGLNGNKISEQFDLSPGETKKFQLVSNAFDKEGNYNTEASVSCSNSATISDSKPLVVNFMMSRPLRQ